MGLFTATLAMGSEKGGGVKSREIDPSGNSKLGFLASVLILVRSIDGILAS